MRCDLHMHSTCSDGRLTVPELVRAVQAAGVSVFALTDHDTLEGLGAARQEATRLGLEWLSGVEISARLDDVELHILGYGFDVEHPELHALLDEQKRARRERIPKLVARLNELGVELSAGDVYAVAGDANPGRPHVARALVERGHVPDLETAFRRYLGDRGPANLPKSVVPAERAIATIHAAGGKAVWAHPLARAIQRRGGVASLARELAELGLDGLEEMHPAHDVGARKRLRKLAQDLQLKLTGGSDFHGASRGERLGHGGADVPASIVDTLLERH